MLFLRGIFHMATRGTFTSCQRRLHICWCANVLLLLVKEVFFPLWGGMRAIPTSTFAVFWRKANVKRALASVPPVTWKRVKELTTAHQKWRAAVPREIWREKEAPKLRPSPRELFKKEVLWPTRQFKCSLQNMEKQAAVPHHCDHHKNPAWEKLSKEDMTPVESSTKEVVSTKQQRREVWFCHDTSISQILCLHFTWGTQGYYWTMLKGKC